MAPRISVCALAAGLGLVGGVVILETLPTASSGPSGRVRPAGARSSGPPPSSPSAGAGIPVTEAGFAPDPPRHPYSTSESEGSEPPERSVRISGRVEIDLGRPVAGAWVYGPSRPTGRRRGGYDCWGPVWTATSDEEGSFAVEVPLSRFEGNRGPPISARAIHLLPSRDAGVPVMLGEPWEPANLDGAVIVLRRPAVVEGTVRDGEGQVIPGAEVLFGEGARPGATFLGRGSSRRADRHGKVRYEVDPEDDPAVECHAVAYGMEGPSVAIHGGFVAGGTMTVEIPLPAGGEDRFSGRGPWVLAGRVTDCSGRPVTGARLAGSLVRNDDEAGWTGRSGQAGAFEVLLEGEWYDRSSITATAPGFAPRRLRIEEEVRGALRRRGRVEGFAITLARGAVLEGCVRDAEGPIPGALVGLADDEENADPGRTGWSHPDFFGADRRTADGEGRFRFEDLESREDLVLFVRSEGRTPTPFRIGGSLRPGETLARDFLLQPLRTVPLEVVFTGWRSGVEARLDREDRAPVPATWKSSVATGPHEIEVVDGNGHGLCVHRFFADPAEEKAVVEVPLPACARCAAVGE